MAAVSLYQDSISQSLNAVIEQRTPHLIMPVFNQATGKTTPKKPRAKRKPKIKQELDVKTEPTDWSAFDVSAANVAEECNTPMKKIKQEKITDHLVKVKKKRDRFNGMPEEEVALRLLPDHLAENLEIVIVGINPGLFAAYVGHHYAGPGNHFWKCLYLSGLIPEPMNAYEDFKLLEYGIGFTNICARTTRGSADLKRSEIKEGGNILKEKLLKYKPKIAAFNGKGIYEIFCGHKKFSIGKQPEPLEGTDTVVYVMPSSSARCAQLPRAVDKVPFYEALKKIRDYLRGDIKDLNESEVTFPKLELKIKKEEPVDDGYIKAEIGTYQDIGQAKPKPKKKRNRKSAEATVTSREITSTYSGEVAEPYDSAAVTSHCGPTVPYVKQEQPFSSNEYGGVSSANNFPFSTLGVTLPTTMASHYVTSQSYPQAPYHFPLQPPYMPPTSAFHPSLSSFNPPMSQVPNYTQHQIAHMSNNGFLANLNMPPAGWNQFQPNPQQYHPNIAQPILGNDSPENNNVVQTSQNSSPLHIKSEPIDSEYKEYDLTKL